MGRLGGQRPLLTLSQSSLSPWRWAGGPAGFDFHLGGCFSESWRSLHLRVGRGLEGLWATVPSFSQKLGLSQAVGCTIRCLEHTGARTWVSRSRVLHPWLLLCSRVGSPRPSRAAPAGTVPEVESTPIRCGILPESGRSTESKSRVGNQQLLTAVLLRV